MYKRPAYNILLARLQEPRKFIQVLSGPRQVGKTTLVRQVMDAVEMTAHYASADEPTLRDRTWIEQQWDLARLRAKEAPEQGEALLVLDEIQKIPGWSEVIKGMWDEDKRLHVPLKVVLLGSAPLLIQSGLSETLAGRFEIIRVNHWSFSEMGDAFGLDVESFIYFGGYPGAAGLIGDEQRWANYIVDSLIETTLSRDILLMTRVDKPALLRRLFLLGCDYSGRILSYQKMLGQLQDVGNTTTLSHYLELLSGAGLLTGIGKFSGEQVRRRGSSPKLQVLNTALLSAQSDADYDTARTDRDFWGRLVESAVGAHLINSTAGTRLKVFYWRDRSREVDFILKAGKQIAAIEVKSGQRKGNLSGLSAFCNRFPTTRKLLVGPQGISLQEFLSTPPGYWVKD